MADVDELYDLESDPTELHNLIHHQEYEDVRREMYHRMFNRMKETRDPFYRDLWWPKFGAVRQNVDFSRDLMYGVKS